MIHLDAARIHSAAAIARLPKGMLPFPASLTYPDPTTSSCPGEIDQHTAGIPL